jgi:hypothetical protein
MRNDKFGFYDISSSTERQFGKSGARNPSSITRIWKCLASGRGILVCASEIIPSNRKAFPIKLVVGVVGRPPLSDWTGPQLSGDDE